MCTIADNDNVPMGASVPTLHNTIAVNDGNDTVMTTTVASESVRNTLLLLRNKLRGCEMLEDDFITFSQEVLRIVYCSQLGGIYWRDTVGSIEQYKHQCGGWVDTDLYYDFFANWDGCTIERMVLETYIKAYAIAYDQAIETGNLMHKDDSELFVLALLLYERY